MKTIETNYVTPEWMQQMKATAEELFNEAYLFIERYKKREQEIKKIRANRIN